MTEQRVVAPDAHHGVVAVKTLDQVRPRVAVQDIVVIRPAQVLDADIRVSRRIPRIAALIVEIRRQPCSRHEIIRIVDALAAIENVRTTLPDKVIRPGAAGKTVRTETAVKPVVSAAAVQRIVACISGQIIAEPGPLQPLDIDIYVARGISGIPRPIGETGRHAAIRIGIARDIEPVAPV